MRSVEEHLAAILDLVRPLPPYEQPLLEALGLPICEDVVSDVDLPGFDNSAMDGYACRLGRRTEPRGTPRSGCRSWASRPQARRRRTRSRRARRSRS